MSRSVIVIGSTNQLKMAAVVNALQVVGRREQVVCIDIPSAVAEQPVGLAETLRGAQYRAVEAMKGNGDAILAIGIENGLRQKGDDWEDWAVINLLKTSGESIIIHTEAVAMPAEIVGQAVSQGMTAGKVLAVQNSIAVAQDPHSFLTGGQRSRLEILQAAIVAGLKLVLSGPMSYDREFHFVEIGGVARLFPIREVAPGVKVALFNPLGDWEFGEKAGQALAAKIPAEAQVLLMPDGKAQALLHVIGRESQLPTIVARKEKKPYMLEPVLKAVVRSITTTKEQALYLGADDVEFLRGKNIVIVDDVVSTGGTLKAMKALLETIDAQLVGVMAVFTEGRSRPDVICLGNLPLY